MYLTLVPLLQGISYFSMKVEPSDDLAGVRTSDTDWQCLPLQNDWSQDGTYAQAHKVDSSYNGIVGVREEIRHICGNLL